MTQERMSGYRAPQVCTLVGITYRQLDYWARTKLIVPSLQRATGSGSQRLYSFIDVVQLKVIKRLLDAGMSLKKIRSAVEILRIQLDSDQPLADVTLLRRWTNNLCGTLRTRGRRRLPSRSGRLRDRHRSGTGRG